MKNMTNKNAKNYLGFAKTKPNIEETVKAKYYLSIPLKLV